MVASVFRAFGIFRTVPQAARKSRSEGWWGLAPAIAIELAGFWLVWAALAQLGRQWRVDAGLNARGWRSSRVGVPEVAGIAGTRQCETKTAPSELVASVSSTTKHLFMAF